MIGLQSNCGYISLGVFVAAVYSFHSSNPMSIPFFHKRWIKAIVHSGMQHSYLVCDRDQVVPISALNISLFATASTLSLPGIPECPLIQ
jgi:hypothetical protein